MTHTITVQDGTGDNFSPAVIVGFSPTAESANEVHELIDGSIVVTLLGDRLRSGSLSLRFSSDDAAEIARGILGRASWFMLASTTRPVVDMAFTRAGSMTPTMHESIKGLWSFEVGFQEIIP